MSDKNLCKTCKHWSVEVIHDWPNPSKLANIGECSKIQTYVPYWNYCTDDVNAMVQDGKIGCDNLHTHENFGCIHHTKSEE